METVLVARVGRNPALVLLGWLLLNLLQAYFTELGHDEAYYVQWSQKLDWGYFDHPPMVALLIAPGYLLLHNELGVRLLFVLIGVAALCCVYLLTDRKHPALYLAITLSTSLLWLGGFSAAPDIPLFFFTALFFLSLREYLEHDTFRNTLALSLIIPFMLYSKYFGILVVLFSVIANPHILKRRSFLIIAIISCLLLTPHFLWQARNGFPTLDYHFGDRIHGTYQPELTVRYILGQFLATGPLIGFLTLFTAFRFQARSQFERALKFNLVGTFAFCFFLTLGTKVHENWTVTAFVPLLVLSYQDIVERPSTIRWAYYLALPSVVLMILWRIHMVHPLFDVRDDKTAEWRGWRTFAEEIRDQAGGRPIVATTYQIASKLSFYTDEVVPALSTGERRSQYNLWRLEKDLQGSDVLFVTFFPPNGADPVPTPDDDTVYVKPIQGMRTYEGTNVEIMNDSLRFQCGATTDLRVRVILEGATRIDNNNEYPLRLGYRLYLDGVHVIPDGPTSILPTLIEDRSVHTLRVRIPAVPASYLIEPFLESKGFTSWEIGRRREIVVY